MNAVAIADLRIDVPLPKPTGGVGKRRLVADRFRRVWQMVQEIAERPGQTRVDLSERFHLSERQVQADLNIIRSEMRLPLVRRQGYRFVDEGTPSAEMICDLRDAQMLVLLLQHASRDRSIPDERMRALRRKLPAMFPSHLTPLVQRTLEAVIAPRSGSRHQVFSALADALLRGASVRLHHDALIWPYSVHEPIVTPELLLPYLGSWFVLGHCHQTNRSMMVDLEIVTAVTFATVGDSA